MATSWQRRSAQLLGYSPHNQPLGGECKSLGQSYCMLLISQAKVDFCAGAVMFMERTLSGPRI